MVVSDKTLKVTFVCGSLEEGKDGVGDYVRRLAGHLLKEKHMVWAIALNDKHIGEPCTGDQDAEGSTLAVLRLPSAASSEIKTKLAADFIRANNPDIISLQFVPYAFHLKGLPFNLCKELQRSAGSKMFHIMFHELWLDTPLGVKQRITAWIQRLLIKNLVSHLKPYAINVSIPFNKLRLKEIGIDTSLLGLFGNIYSNGASEQTDTSPGVQSRSMPAVIYFGAPPKGVFRQVFIKEIDRFCKESVNGVKLILACGNSDEKNRFLKLVHEQLNGKKYELIDCGFLTVGELSRLLSECDAGISKSTARLLGKSGAAIAMLEHGLPIWMPNWDGVELLSVSFRHELIFSNLSEAVRSGKMRYQPLIKEVAVEFVNQFTVKESI